LILEPALLILLLTLIGFFAAAETVFLSVSRIRLEGFIHLGMRRARMARYFLDKPSRFVLTTLVGVNIATVTFSSILTAYLDRFQVPTGWIYATGTLATLIFGEVIPKSLARDLADQSVLWVSPLLRFFQIILYPAIVIFRRLTYFVMSLFGVPRHETRLFFTRRDLEILIREGIKTGDLPLHDDTLIARTFRLPQRRAGDIMTPRTEIVALETSATPDDLRRVVLTSGYSKILIYEKDLDHINGVAYARDLLDRPPDLTSIIKTVSFFPDQKKATDVFHDLRRAQQSIAVVVDEWGGTAGVVTIEDVIEELTGDIEDEFDREQHRIRRLADGRFVVPGRMEITEINHRLDLAIPEGDYTTLGGFLITQLERIPAVGETYALHEVEYKIARASKTRISLVVVRRMSDDEKG
jgi:CBS domain containing-hemolysin-like protein